MKDSWILDWHITRYGTSDEYDSFEEAKNAFRSKIAREIGFEYYLDHMNNELASSDNGEEIANFLTNFFDNTLEEQDVIETSFEGGFNATFNADGFKIKESELYGLQTFPTIESNFVFMNDCEKQYRFYFNDPYNFNGIDPEFDGYDYEITLRKKTKEDYMEWVTVEDEDGSSILIQKLPDDFEE